MACLRPSCDASRLPLCGAFAPLLAGAGKHGAVGGSQQKSRHKRSAVVQQDALSSLVGGAKARHAAATGGSHSTAHGRNLQGPAGGAAGAHGQGGTGQVHHPHHGHVTANALVAFLEEGIEVLHLYTGACVVGRVAGVRTRQESNPPASVCQGRGECGRNVGLRKGGVL